MMLKKHVIESLKKTPLTKKECNFICQSPIDDMDIILESVVRVRELNKLL